MRTLLHPTLMRVLLNLKRVMVKLQLRSQLSRNHKLTNRQKIVFLPSIKIQQSLHQLNLIQVWRAQASKLLNHSLWRLSRTSRLMWICLLQTLRYKNRINQRKVDLSRSTLQLRLKTQMAMMNQFQNLRWSTYQLAQTSRAVLTMLTKPLWKWIQWLKRLRLLMSSQMRTN